MPGRSRFRRGGRPRRPSPVSVRSATCSSRAAAPSFPAPCTPEPAASVSARTRRAPPAPASSERPLAVRRGPLRRFPQRAALLPAPARPRRANRPTAIGVPSRSTVRWQPSRRRGRRPRRPGRPGPPVAARGHIPRLDGRPGSPQGGKSRADRVGLCGHERESRLRIASQLVRAEVGGLRRQQRPREAATGRRAGNGPPPRRARSCRPVPCTRSGHRRPHGPIRRRSAAAEPGACGRCRRT